MALNSKQIEQIRRFSLKVSQDRVVFSTITTLCKCSLLITAMGLRNGFFLMSAFFVVRIWVAQAEEQSAGNDKRFSTDNPQILVLRVLTEEKGRCNLQIMFTAMFSILW